MFKCKVFPYPITSKRPEIVMPAAYEFIERWKAETPGKHPCVEVRCFGEPRQRVFIASAFRHIDYKRFVPNIARRYRFLPCVRELLMESTDSPVPTRDGNLMLEGKAPTKETFRVIIGEGEIEPGLTGYKLVTFYPVTK